MFTLMWPHLFKSLSWSLYSNPGPCPGPWEWSPCPGLGLWNPSPGPGPWWKFLVNITAKSHRESSFSILSQKASKCRQWRFPELLWKGGVRVESQMRKDRLAVGGAMWKGFYCSPALRVRYAFNCIGCWDVGLSVLCRPSSVVRPVVISRKLSKNSPILTVEHYGRYWFSRRIQILPRLTGEGEGDGFFLWKARLWASFLLQIRYSCFFQNRSGVLVHYELRF